MSSTDYDMQTYNTVAALQAGVTTAQAAYDIAKVTSDALTQRLAAFSSELGVAQARLSTAESDSAAADAAEKSVAGSLVEALKATRQALIIHASVRNTLQLAEAAAQQALAAGYDVSETLSYVTAASAKNSFITRKLLAAAEQADASASAAVSAAVTALKDATDACIETERAAGASFLVVAGLLNLQSLMTGYTTSTRSNVEELPSALRGVPPIRLADVPQLPPPPARITPAIVRSFDRFLLQQTPELISSDKLDRSPFSDLPGNADLLEFTVADYVKTAEGTRARKAPLVAPAKLADHSGLQPGFQWVYATARAYETETQDATILTQKAATEAAQDLSRKAARLQTAQNALAAARQAAGT
jgi:hypothetical protein